jgi:hypothetical protein
MHWMEIPVCFQPDGLAKILGFSSVPATNKSKHISSQGFDEAVPGDRIARL